MRGNEDRTIITRNLKNRLPETLLLIIGLALGIGASAAGFALVLKSMKVSSDILQSQQYREIIVSSRQSSGDMDVPVIMLEQEQSVILTSLDLQASKDAPDITYSYIKQPTTFHSTASFLEQAISTGRGRNASASTPSPTGDISSQQPKSSQQGGAGLLSLPDPIDDPQPLLSQWPGYLVSPEFFDAWDLQVRNGSLFTLSDVSLSANIMVLGSRLASTLYEEGQALGKRFISGPTVYEIIGILEETGTPFDDMAFAKAFMPDLVGDVHLPNSAMLQSRWNTSLSFMVDDPSRLELASAQVETYFLHTYGPGSVVISIPRYEAQMANDRNARIVTMILFLALAGLFIAAVNVSNILLGRALRRQKTIGILKALGASKQKIFRLFFHEALTIGIIASLLGVGISIVLAELMQQTAQLGSIDPLLLSIGIAASWLITTALTIFPAIQASKIPAAEAMRTE